MRARIGTLFGINKKPPSGGFFVPAAFAGWRWTLGMVGPPLELQLKLQMKLHLQMQKQKPYQAEAQRRGR